MGWGSQRGAGEVFRRSFRGCWGAKKGEGRGKKLHGEFVDKRG